MSKSTIRTLITIGGTLFVALFFARTEFGNDVLRVRPKFFG